MSLHRVYFPVYYDKSLSHRPLVIWY
jgi:hypothetical protein